MSNEHQRKFGMAGTVWRGPSCLAMVRVRCGAADEAWTVAAWYGSAGEEGEDMLGRVWIRQGRAGEERRDEVFCGVARSDAAGRVCRAVVLWLRA
jgi:hypothetical protein